MLVEPARRFDLRHFRLRRDVEADAALDQLLLRPRWLFEVDPRRAVGNLLGMRLDDASVATGSIGPQHAPASFEQPLFASRPALLDLEAMTRTRRAAVAAVILVVAAAATLLAMGRHPICTCGRIDLWVA